MNSPPTNAVAAIAAHKNELLLFHTLLELAIIVIAGRLGGMLATRLGQTAAVGEIVLGILLGPSLFGLLAPRAFEAVFHSAPAEPLTVLSSLGLVMLMFQIGLEFDFAHLTQRVNRAAVARVSAACLGVPFACGLIFGYYLGTDLEPARRLNSALFIATAFSITALPILGRIMIEFDLTRTRLGVIAICSAAINDVAGWLMLALITALTLSELSAGYFALRVGLIAVFGTLSATAMRPLLKHVIRRSAPRAGRMSPNLLGLMLAVIFASAMLTYELGIFAIFGGFMMGVILFDELEFVAAWRAQVGHFVTVFFLPIFFTYTGLRTSIGSLHGLSDWGLCFAVIGIANAAKLGSGYLAARLSALSRREAAVIGFMMNTRALMELIVLNVGLDLGAITPKLFTMLVMMAIVSTMIVTPALRYLLPRTALAPERQPQSPPVHA